MNKQFGVFKTAKAIVKWITGRVYMGTLIYLRKVVDRPDTGDHKCVEPDVNFYHRHLCSVFSINLLSVILCVRKFILVHPP